MHIANSQFIAMMTVLVHHCLLNLPFREPTLVERQSYIYAERVFHDIFGCGAAHPLPTDVENGTIVPAVHDWDAKSEARAQLLRPFNAIYIIIRCGIRHSHAIANPVEEMTIILAWAILGAQRDPVTILVHSRAHGVRNHAVFGTVSRLFHLAPLLESVVGANP